MSHTQKQASELWCPMVRSARHEVIRRETAKLGDIVAISEDHYIADGCNTDAIGGTRIPASCLCIVDKCAMWRWLPKTHHDGSILHGEAATHGYCGLAGRPEVM